jgi:hypothetical protein
MEDKFKPLFLTIFDNGDMSVGISPQSWSVKCPFFMDEDKEIQEQFREDILNAYKEFSEGKLNSFFDYENI